MELLEAADLLLDEMNRFGLLREGWKPRIDRAKKRFGCCSYHRRTISLSGPLVVLNTREEVHDTILHEIAHALAFLEYGEDCGHDERWKAVCLQIGARPTRCYSRDIVRQPDAKWLLVHQETGEIFHHYHRKPLRNPASLYIRGRKKETMGKLVIMRNPNC